MAGTWYAKRSPRSVPLPMLQTTLQPGAGRLSADSRRRAARGPSSPSRRGRSAAAWPSRRCRCRRPGAPARAQERGRARPRDASRLAPRGVQEDAPAHLAGQRVLLAGALGQPVQRILPPARAEEYVVPEGAGPERDVREVVARPFPGCRRASSSVSNDAIVAMRPKRVKGRIRARKASACSSVSCERRSSASTRSTGRSGSNDSARARVRCAATSGPALAIAQGLTSMPCAVHPFSRRARTRKPLAQPTSRTLRTSGNVERRKSAVFPNSPQNALHEYPPFQLLLSPVSK